MVRRLLHRIAHHFGWNHGRLDCRWVCGKLVVFFTCSCGLVSRSDTNR